MLSTLFGFFGFTFFVFFYTAYRLRNDNFKTSKDYFLGGKRGWIGDSPFIYLGTKKILSTGWKPKFTIKESIKITSDFLMSNKWLLKRK